MYGGVAVGKTFTGCHHALNHIVHHPEMTGLIGANTHDQLSQTTLKAMFEWLDFYQMPFVVDSMPIKSWKAPRLYKSYKNTLSVFNPKTRKTVTILTRVLSDGNPIRGIELSWYWLDETRDTPEDTHNVLISRMRETKGYIRGLITTTTNGEDWSYRRFCLNNNGDGIYGSMHVPTSASLELGIIDQNYYNTMIRSYTELMALQELEAKHINVMGGKAYYSASDANRTSVAPWGDTTPSRDRALVVGCDFNFAPAPCVWMCGQRGPNLYGPDGILMSDKIHWFGEISGREMSTVQMTHLLMQRYPEFEYRVYGDVSGGMGTTSNAGVTDYEQIANTLNEWGCDFSIDYFQMDADESHANPRVRSRVENMNTMFKNALGEMRQTWDPVGCPYLDGDIKMVGWKPQTSNGRGKLDNAGDIDRTHASDGAGYAVFKMFPPGRRATILPSIPSTIRREHGLIDERDTSDDRHSW